MTSPPDDILDLLTAYALGVIEPEEIARVSALLDEQPELRATLAELRATADMLPYGLPEASQPARRAASARARPRDRTLLPRHGQPGEPGGQPHARLGAGAEWYRRRGRAGRRDWMGAAVPNT